MSEAKHTPGPWVADPDGFVRKRLNEFTSVHVATVYGAERGSDRNANARLIAAAPELLEACHAICEAMAFAPEEELTARLNDAYNLCRAAIDKAGGRS